jgi:NitT/TauT family transport system substrate-binding protein
MNKHIKTCISFLLITGAVLSVHAEEKLKPFKVGYNNWVGFIGLFVAQEKGYFAEEGLEVSTVSFASPGEGLVPLMNGNLDAHFTTADSVILREAQAPGSLKIVYLVDTSNGADALIGSKAVESVADLKGKKVATTVGECNHLLLVKALETAGLTEKDITLVNLDPDAAGTALKAGQVDAAVTWEPWISQIIGEGGKTLFTTAKTPNLILDCLAVSGKDADKEAVQAFVNAMNKAQAFVMAEPAAASKILSPVIDWPADEIEATLPTLTLYDLAGNKAQFAGPAKKAAKEIVGFFKAQEVIEKDVDVDAIFDAGYLK